MKLTNTRKTSKAGQVMLFAAVVVVLMLPEMAYAQTGGGGGLPLLDLAKRVFNWLGGDIARYLAMITGCVIGYACWDGRVEWDKMKSWTIGCGIVFGIAQIVALVSGSGG